jgi:hypothetical protein
MRNEAKQRMTIDEAHNWVEQTILELENYSPGLKEELSKTLHRLYLGYICRLEMVQVLQAILAKTPDEPSLTVVPGGSPSHGEVES